MDVQPQIGPLNWKRNSVAHSRENCRLWPSVYKAWTYGRAAFQKILLSNASAQRIKTWSKEHKTWEMKESEHQWTFMQSFGSQRAKQISSSFILQRKHFFSPFNKHSFGLWKHLKKAWICFVGKAWHGSLLGVILSTLAQVLMLDGRGCETRDSFWTHQEVKKVVKMSCAQNGGSQ